MKPIDERLLRVSPLLRKKCREVELLARDLKIKLLLEALLWEGEYYTGAVDAICRRFGISRTTVKRAARRFPTERPKRVRRPRRRSLGVSGAGSTPPSRATDAG